MSHPDLRPTWLALLSTAPAVGSRWRHRKTGGVYEVVALSLDEPTHAPLVTYRAGDGVCWTRDRAAFGERFEREGK